MNYCQDDCALALEQIARTISEKKVHVLIGDKDGRTAICPHCFIDAVLPDSSPYSLSPAFLRQMNKKWL